ncbi:hypothetical protein BC830DRAFT_1175813 [Chytriomyces sp. MP71]|nr:hypothetical protein BC830DRAFT_1175813 [Chytriomyces sp. MP71]
MLEQGVDGSILFRITNDNLRQYVGLSTLAEHMRVLDAIEQIRPTTVPSDVPISTGGAAAAPACRTLCHRPWQPCTALVLRVWGTAQLPGTATARRTARTTALTKMDPSNARFPAVVYALAAVPALVMACVAVSLPRLAVSAELSLVALVRANAATASPVLNITTWADDAGPASLLVPSNAVSWPLDVDPILAGGSVALRSLAFSFGAFGVCAHFETLNATNHLQRVGAGSPNQTCVDIDSYCASGRVR